MGQRRRWRLLLLLCFLAVLMATPAHAAKHRKEWVQKKNGYWYYYDAKGKKAKGLTKIGKRTYYFTDTGRQLLGWRKIGKYYYRFRNVAGKGGYLFQNNERNGIKLGAKGRAKVKEAAAKRKVKLLVKYQLWVEEFTKPTMTRQEKLYACLRTLRNYRYTGEGEGVLQNKNWDMVCAEDVYNRRFGYSRANCYRFAAALGYMANAIGYRNVQVCAVWGHGWTVINGTIYDPAKAVNRNDMSYFPANGRRGEYSSHPSYDKDLRKL